MRRLGILGLIFFMAANAGAMGVGVQPALAGGSAPTLAPPVIHEQFTLLPCTQGTTLGMEGCAEHDLLRADTRIDKEVRLLFSLLFDNAARERLTKAQVTWMAFRQADCRSQSDVYEGGTQAAVEFGRCALSDDKARSGELHAFYLGLVQGRHNAPRFP